MNTNARMNDANASECVERATDSAVSGELITTRERFTTEQRMQQARDVITLIEQGASETQACAAVGINRLTFRNWALRANAVNDYARATEALALAQVERLEQTIAEMRDGTLSAEQARVEIDARKWFASKFLPKRWGEHRTIEHSGSVSLVPQEMTEDQIRERLAALDSASASG